MFGPLIIPYVFPMMLGRTFDLNTMRVGVDIFPKEVIENRQIYDVFFGSSRYGLMESSNDRKNLLGVLNPLPSYIKSGILKAGFAGEYLSDTILDVKTVDMITRTFWKSSIEYLPLNAKPIPNWKDYGEALGTHYVDEIHYGGDMIASMRFDAKTNEDMQKISPPISQGVFKLGSHVEDEYLKSILKLVESSQFKIFSSLPLSHVPNSMESLNKSFHEEFKDVLKQFNKGRGLPLLVRLRPLRNFDSSRDISVDERILGYRLGMHFDDYFEDLMQTKALISQWMKNIVKPLTEEQEHKVADLCNSLENMLKLFYEALDTLGTPQGPDQLKKAREAYQKEGFIPSVFIHKYYRLRLELDKDYKVGSAMQCSKQCSTLEDQEEDNKSILQNPSEKSCDEYRMAA